MQPCRLHKQHCCGGVSPPKHSIQMVLSNLLHRALNPFYLALNLLICLKKHVLPSKLLELMPWRVCFVSALHISLMYVSFLNNRMGRGVVGPGGIWGRVKGVGSYHWGIRSQP